MHEHTSSPFFLPLFVRAVVEVVAPKTAKELALECKEQGNDCYLKGDYHGAIQHFSQAIKHDPGEGIS